MDDGRGIEFSNECLGERGDGRLCERCGGRGRREGVVGVVCETCELRFYSLVRLSGERLRLHMHAVRGWKVQSTSGTTCAVTNRELLYRDWISRDIRKVHASVMITLESLVTLLSYVAFGETLVLG